jgi:thioredoxin reductase (NADPH)
MHLIAQTRPLTAYASIVADWIVVGALLNIENFVSTPYLNIIIAVAVIGILHLGLIWGGLHTVGLMFFTAVLLPVEHLARAFDLNVRQYEEVVSVARNDEMFVVGTRTLSGTTAEYSARNVVIATGYFDSPNMLRIPGEDSPRVAHRYREGHSYFDQDVIVVGGGNSAVDAALELHHWGARVTIVHFAESLDPNVKPWVRPDIDARIREGAIGARFGARLVEVRASTALVETIATGALEEVGNDWVLAMTGYMPDGKLPKSLGVEYDPVTGIPRHDPGTMETNVPGVFIAGVLSAGFNANKVFIENGRGHGELIARAVAAKLKGEQTAADGTAAR